MTRCTTRGGVCCALAPQLVFFSATNNWYFSAFQTYFMFEIRLKVSCSLIYLSAQLEKSSSIFKDALLLFR